MSRVQPISLWFDFWVWLIIYMEPKKKITCYVFKWLGDLIWKCNYISVYASNVGSNFVGRNLWHPHLPPSAAEYLPVPPLTRHKNLRVIWGLIISSQENTQKNKTTNEHSFSWPLNVSSQSLCDVTTSVERNVLNISKLIRGFAAWIIVWLSCRKGCLAFKIPL